MHCISRFFFFLYVCIDRRAYRHLLFGVLFCHASHLDTRVSCCYIVCVRNNWPGFTPHTSIVQATSWWHSADIHMCFGQEMYSVSMDFVRCCFESDRMMGVSIYYMRYAQLNLQTHPNALSTAIFFPFHCVDEVFSSTFCRSFLRFARGTERGFLFQWHFNPCVTNYSPLDTLSQLNKSNSFSWKKIE